MWMHDCDNNNLASLWLYENFKKKPCTVCEELMEKSALAGMGALVLSALHLCEAEHSW